MVQVKICGLKTPEAVDTALIAGADYIGLVHFSKSPRHVSLEQAAQLAGLARGRTKIVLLLVNPAEMLVKEAVEVVSPDFIQLHGDESPERVAAIKRVAGCPVIKALKVEAKEDVAAVGPYLAVADLILFDAKPPKGAELPGGNGIPFDWELLKGFKSRQDYMLSGGLDPETVVEAIEATGAPVVDVSSGVESAPGIKDLDKIGLFVERAKQQNQTF